MDIKGSEKKVFKKLRPINAKFFKKLGDEGRKSIKNAFDSLQAEKQTEGSLNIYATNNNSVSETYEQKDEVKKVPGERKILVQKVEIVFPPRRVSQFFNKTYQPDKHSNESATYDNYCDTEQTTEVPSSYDNSIHTMKTKVEPLETTDDTIMNSNETKNTNLGQNLLDTPDTLVNSTNTIKFTSKCPENRSNNIIPLKMKRIIKKPKIILRTSRFGRTQLLNAAQSIPAIESIPVAVDSATRLDDAIEIHNTSEGNVSKVEILSECSKHTDIPPQEQGSELVLNSEIEEIPVMTIDNQAESNILVPQQHTFDEEFRGFKFDEKDSEADVQIKHLEKVLQTLNNFQDDPDTTQEFIDPQCDVTQEWIGPQSQVTQEWIDPKSLIPTQEYIESQIQTKVLHRFELKKDDIEKLDETLKEVSFNLNSWSVSEDLELENKKLKLVVKHLMNKLQVSSLQETFDFDEEIVNLTENVDMESLVTEEAIDATMQEDAHDNIDLTIYNDNVELIQPIDVITVNDDNYRKRKLSLSDNDVNETFTKISKTVPLLEESSITLLDEPSTITDRTNVLEITSPDNSLFSSPISSRRNSAESFISEAPTHISIEVKIKDDESTIVETIVPISTLVESIPESSSKEKKDSSRRSSKVEKQTLKRSNKEHKSSRTSSIEPIPTLKKDKKSLVQTKLCFNKQIESKKGNIATSTPQKNLRSSRSEPASNTNKNEMIRIDYVKVDTESKKNTISKDVKPATDFCKAMEELNVIKKSKKPRLGVNDVKSTSTPREQYPRSSNKSKADESINDVTVPSCEVVPEPLPVPIPAEQKPTVSKESKTEKKYKEVIRKKSIENIVNNKSEITKETPGMMPSPKPKRGKKSLASSQTLIPPIIPTEVLEKAVESLVPYDEILTVLRFSSHVTTGRPTLQEKATIERKRKETKKLLEKLKYFHCGNCQKDVTKQKWKDHWKNHGGIAWIDGFEKAFNLNDWEESLRRFVNNMKTYKVASLICSKCSEERKSALGHMSHIIICGFDDETVERRKKECTTCDAKILPFNYPYHKKTCSGLIELQSKVEEIEVEDPPANELDSSGRVKRKAVQKAEKKFKSMLKVFANPLDNLKEKNGVFKCRLCVQSFKDQEVAINHVKSEHDTAKDLYETEDTGSDASVHDGSSSDESDGSSGDEESEFQTNSDDDSDVILTTSTNNNNNNSRKRAPRPLQTTLSHDSQELMHVRMCISKIVGDLRKMQRISTATLKWSSESHNKNWIKEVFPELIAAVTVDPILDATSVLQSLNFNTNSMKFTNRICTTVSQFEHKFNIKDDDWEQLHFSDVKYDKQGITMFCGGQVSSLDWSPSNSMFNFLAVACNNDESRESNQMVTQSQKSVIQIFQFNNLNISVDKDKNCCNLMYAFIVDDGPVWSVKFCPTGAPSSQRIGLIAVSTAIGDVLIYSLPNVLKASPSLLQLEASVVCKLKDEMIFNDIFNQACQLTWFHNSNNINLLTAGFLDGTVAIWDMNNMKSLKKEVTSNVIYPSSVVPAHIERITALDIRSTDDAIYLITTGLDRKVRTFCMTETNVLYEVSNYQCKSRLFCAKWWHNWPSMLLGEDDCFTPNSLFMRNPYEMAYRYHSFFAFPGSVIDMTINHYQNTAMFVTDSGDVLGYDAPQLLTCSDSKFKEKELKFHSFADFSKITTGAADEIGVIFCDLKDPCSIASRKRRIDDIPYINNLQINQICFNRNEESNKFYALGYANGFVRVRFIPNPK